MNLDKIHVGLIGYSKVFVQVIHNLILAAKHIILDSRNIQVHLQEQTHGEKVGYLYVQLCV